MTSFSVARYYHWAPQAKSELKKPGHEFHGLHEKGRRLIADCGLRARAEINSHFGASAGRADARRRDEGDVGHRRGAATKQMPARRRAPSGCGPQPAWGPAAKCEFISARALSEERANQLAIVGDLDGTAVCVELLVGIDAQDLVDGECQVLNRHRIILGVRGRGRCASYHYTSADFNTREGNREGPRPVISSRIVFEAWGTSEFGQNEH